MARPIQVAVIGCGWAGVRHARAHAQCGAKIRWAVDTDIRRAQSFQELGSDIKMTRDCRDALADAEVDAVDICLPHHLHASVAVDATQAGKHVLVEKPVAATLDEADRMVAAAAKANVVLMVAENQRFSPLYREVAALVKDGAIGKPALFQMTRECYLTRSFMEDRPWFLDARAAAGGMMMSGGVHDFEKVRMVLGEVESVHSLRAPQRFLEMEGDDTSIALIRLRNGAVGTMVQSFVMKTAVTASGAEVHTMRIDGDLGSIRVSGTHGGTIRIYSEREDYRTPEGLVEREVLVPEEDTFLLEIEHFLRCVRTGEEPLTSGRSQRRPLKIVLAAYRSMETGLPVALG